jgi:hypothetical protein
MQLSHRNMFYLIIRYQYIGIHETQVAVIFYVQENFDSGVLRRLKKGVTISSPRIYFANCNQLTRLDRFV